MKNIILIFTLILVSFGSASAHFMWIETNPIGEIGEEHEIKIYFGEFTYDMKELTNGKSFNKMKDFSLWVVDHVGNRMNLKATPKEDHYSATFTPHKEGVFTILLDNHNIPVIDFTKYDFGIFKPHYNAVSKVRVGSQNKEELNPSNSIGLTIKDVSNRANKAMLQVLYKNEPLPEAEVVVFMPGQWSKTLKTNKVGMVYFDYPWETKYVVEVTKKEEKSGVFNSEKYEFIWHCASYSIQK